MKLEDASGNVPVSWTPTMNLRWINKAIAIPGGLVKKEKTLQQQWQRDKGAQEWRDIQVGL